MDKGFSELYVGNRIYREAFDQGPGGWIGHGSNVEGPKKLETTSSRIISRSPWWIDYNHAPPGAGYLHMLFILPTKGPFGEAIIEAGGVNHFVQGRFPTDFRDATLSFRLRGELIANGADVVFLVQGSRNGLVSGWALTGRPLKISSEWALQTVTATPDPKLWTCLGGRHDRRDSYGAISLCDSLSHVDVNLMLILFPLTIAPMGPIEGDPHILRAGKDYPVWQSRLPEGYVELDHVTIEFANDPGPVGPEQQHT